MAACICNRHRQSQVCRCMHGGPYDCCNGGRCRQIGFADMFKLLSVRAAAVQVHILRLRLTDACTSHN